MEPIRKPDIDKSALRVPTDVKTVLKSGAINSYDALQLMGNTVNASADEVNRATDWVNENGEILAENEKERIEKENERIENEIKRRELDDKIQEALDGAYEKAEADREDRFQEAEAKRNVNVEIAKESAKSAQSSASAANAAATTAQGYVNEIKENIKNLPDGSAVSAQVATNKADISQLALFSSANRGAIRNLDFTLFGGKNYIDGCIVNASGNIEEHIGCSISAFVPVYGITRINVYYGTYVREARMAFYDTNYKFVDASGQSSSGSSRAYDVPSNAYYVIITFNTGYNAKIVNAANSSTIWHTITDEIGLQKNVIDIKNKVEKISDDVIRVDTDINGNLNYINDNIVNAEGQLEKYVGFCASDFIKISKQEHASIKWYYGTYLRDAKLVFYANDKVTIVDTFGQSTSTSARSVSVPDGTAYMRVTFEKGYNAVIIDNNTTETIWIPGSEGGIKNDISDLMSKRNKTYTNTKTFVTTAQTTCAIDFAPVIKKGSIVKVEVINTEGAFAANYRIPLYITTSAYGQVRQVGLFVGKTLTFCFDSEIEQIKILAKSNIDGVATLNVTVLGEIESINNKFGKYWASDEIPEYYNENDYLKNQIKTCEYYYKQCAADGDMFVFLTDVHWDDEDYSVKSTDHNPNAKMSIPLIHKIVNELPISYVFSGGDDYTNGGDVRRYTEAIADAANGRIVFVTGNHDYNFNGDNKVAYYHDATAIDKHEYHPHYYFIDNNRNKIRYIVLNSHLNDPSKDGDGDGTGGYLPNRFGAAQIEWLSTTALDMPDGWSAIIFTHDMHSINMANDSIVVINQSIVDVINNNADKIISVIQGHTHRDRVVYCNNGIVPDIITSCDRYEPYEESGGVIDINVTRELGTTSENLFDVVVVDKANHFIHSVRIGGDALDGIDNNAGANHVIERVVYNGAFNVGNTIILPINPLMKGQSINWSSVNSSIVSVNNGVVTANRAGRTSVIATCNEKKVAYMFNVIS